MKKVLMLGLALSAVGFSSCSRREAVDSDVLVWDVVNPKFDAVAEKEFSMWIEKLGTARAQGVCRILC